MNVSVVLLVALLSGCALQQQRQLLFAPESLNAPTSRPAFTEGYARALADAQATQSPDAMMAFVDAGNALNSRNCTEWMNRVTFAQRGLALDDHNLGVGLSLATVIAGIAEANPVTVAILGALGVAAQGLNHNAQADVLAAPSQYQAQSVVLDLLGQCSDQLLAEASGLRFSQAYARLEACRRVCSYEGASAAANQALTATPLTVSPHGAVMLKR